MSPEWIDPKTVSVVTVLVGIVALFVYGKLLTSAQCDKALLSRDEAHQRMIAVYELRIAELTKDRDDYKVMTKSALESLTRTLDAKGAPSPPRKERP